MSGLLVGDEVGMASSAGAGNRRAPRTTFLVRSMNVAAATADLVVAPSGTNSISTSDGSSIVPDVDAVPCYSNVPLSQLRLVGRQYLTEASTLARPGGVGGGTSGGGAGGDHGGGVAPKAIWLRQGDMVMVPQRGGGACMEATVLAIDARDDTATVELRSTLARGQGEQGEADVEARTEKSVLVSDLFVQGPRPRGAQLMKVSMDFLEMLKQETDEDHDMLISHPAVSSPVTDDDDEEEDDGEDSPRAHEVDAPAAAAAVRQEEPPKPSHTDGANVAEGACAAGEGDREHDEEDEDAAAEEARVAEGTEPVKPTVEDGAFFEETMRNGSRKAAVQEEQEQAPRSEGHGAAEDTSWRQVEHEEPTTEDEALDPKKSPSVSLPLGARTVSMSGGRRRHAQPPNRPPQHACLPCNHTFVEPVFSLTSEERSDLLGAQGAPETVVVTFTESKLGMDLAQNVRARRFLPAAAQPSAACPEPLCCIYLSRLGRHRPPAVAENAR